MGLSLMGKSQEELSQERREEEDYKQRYGGSNPLEKIANRELEWQRLEEMWERQESDARHPLNISDKTLESETTDKTKD